MAFTVTDLDTDTTDTTAVADIDTAAVTLPADALIILLGCAELNSGVSNDANHAATPVANTPTAQTWTTRADVDGTAAPDFGGGGDYRLNHLVSTAQIGGSAATGQTINYEGIPAAEYFAGGYHSIAAIAVTGHDTAAPIDEIITTSLANQGGSGSATISDSLASAPAIGSLVVVLLSVGEDSGAADAASNPTIGTTSFGAGRYNTDTDYTKIGVWVREIDGTETGTTTDIDIADLGTQVGNANMTVIVLAPEASTPAAPADPTSIVATAGDGEGTLTWVDETASSPTGTYDIEIAPDPFDTWSAVETDLAAGVQTATETGLTNTTDYRFRIRVQNTEGNNPSEFIESNTFTPTAGAITYTAAIAAVADHHWPFAANSDDSIGSANGTDTGMAYTGAAIAEDAANAATMNARGDRISIPTTTTINNSAQTRKAVGGWFMVDSVELPFCRIYGEGTQTTNFQIVLTPGNTVVVEVRDGATWQVQVYAGISLTAGRAYHMCVVLEGNAFSNVVKFFLDGVEQTEAIPIDRQPDDASLASRGVAEFGDPVGTVGLNGTSLLMQSPGDNRTTEQVITCYYNHWFAIGDSVDAQLSDTEVRQSLFERGALAETTISTGTEAAMQTAIDALSGTTRGDLPLCIEIEAVTGGGDFTLDLDDITFDARASIHVRYNGTSGTLTLRNINGSNCSIVAAPYGGTVNVVTDVTLTVTVRDASDGTTAVESAMVYLVADTGGPLTAGAAIIDRVLTNASGVATIQFDYSADQPYIGDVRRASSAPRYKPGEPVGTITADGLDTIVLLAPE